MMQKQKKKKLIKIIAGVVILGLIGVIIVVAVIFFTPHRDVKNAPTDFVVNAQTLVDEYLEDAQAANQKYLSEDGDSKIFEVNGRVGEIMKNMKEETVILLKPEGNKLGVQCTFTLTEDLSGVKVGDNIKVKGKIEQGASYDEDLEIGADVIIGECSLVK